MDLNFFLPHHGKDFAPTAAAVIADGQ